MAEQVAEASIAIKWVVKGEPFRNKARQLLRDARLKGITLIAPSILEYEVESALQRRLHNGLAAIGSQELVAAALPLIEDWRSEGTKPLRTFALFTFREGKLSLWSPNQECRQLSADNS